MNEVYLDACYPIKTISYLINEFALNHFFYNTEADIINENEFLKVKLSQDSNFIINRLIVLRFWFKTCHILGTKKRNNLLF